MTREEIDELIGAGRANEAACALDELWRREAGPAAASFVVSRFEGLRAELSLVPYRVALLRSFTVEPLVPLLRAACFAAGIDAEVHTGQFNAYAQEILDPESDLYRFAPDAVFLAAHTADVAPELWHGFASLARGEARRVVSRVVSEFQTLAEVFRRHSRAHLVVHTFEEPARPSYGLLDARDEEGQSACVRRINDGLRRAFAGLAGVHLLDYDALVARRGRAGWRDERKWIAARLPVSAANLSHVVGEWMRFLHPLAGRVSKAVAVDLDNTLWGGVVGEDGMAGLKLGDDYPGAAFAEVQRALIDLRARGVLLCLCSKNNEDEALAAVETHPAMLLRLKDFAAVRVNWDDKARNLRALAAELNIATDALAFLDDNPVERAHVRTQLPEVHVVELPGDPLLYADALRSDPFFERLSLSEEDRERPIFYARERERRNSARSATTRAEFLRSLAQVAEVSAVNEATLARAAQLTQKTNQFNLTTRRYTEQQLAEICALSEWQTLALRVRDRFGDNGLVALAIVRHGSARRDGDGDAGQASRDDDGTVSEIDTLLLSCRVIGRGVETALLARVAAEARGRGSRELRGWFFPTKKNAPARDFYAAHGFVARASEERGTLWSLDLSRGVVACPDWIELVSADEVTTDA